MSDGQTHGERLEREARRWVIETNGELDVALARLDERVAAARAEEEQAAADFRAAVQAVLVGHNLIAMDVPAGAVWRVARDKAGAVVVVLEASAQS